MRQQTLMNYPERYPGPSTPSLADNHTPANPNPEPAASVWNQPLSRTPAPGSAGTVTLPPSSCSLHSCQAGSLQAHECLEITVGAVSPGDRLTQAKLKRERSCQRIRKPAYVYMSAVSLTEDLIPSSKVEVKRDSESLWRTHARVQKPNVIRTLSWLWSPVECVQRLEIYRMTTVPT